MCFALDWVFLENEGDSMIVYLPFHLGGKWNGLGLKL